jgi:hypothetical protein
MTLWATPAKSSGSTPWIGCQHASPGCDHCYAESQNAFRKWAADGAWGPHAEPKRTSDANSPPGRTGARADAAEPVMCSPRQNSRKNRKNSRASTHVEPRRQALRAGARSLGAVHGAGPARRGEIKLRPPARGESQLSHRSRAPARCFAMRCAWLLRRAAPNREASRDRARLFGRFRSPCGRREGVVTVNQTERAASGLKGGHHDLDRVWLKNAVDEIPREWHCSP